jgi:hypothetical protein
MFALVTKLQLGNGLSLRYFILRTVASSGTFYNDNRRLIDPQRGSMGMASRCAGFSKNHLKAVSRTFFKERKINYAE